jgi:thiopurine S-methyltransferase
VEATQTKQGSFERWEGDGFVLLCGDFFAVTKADLEGAAAVYDRAALIAMDDRRRYVDHLRALLPVGGPSLLVTIEYPQDQLGGPPFSISDEEVHGLFDEGFEVAQLASEDVLAENGRFTGRVDWLDERAYKMEKK